MVNNCLIYYGSSIPNLTQTKKIKNTLVIMQDYNPLCHQGYYADFFPESKRFLYLNCSQIHRNELGQYDINVKGLKYNKTWDTYILDLVTAEAFDLILNKAKKLLSIEGVDGLFLDDADFWTLTPSLRARFLDLLEKINICSNKEVRIILNRGMCFWHKVKNLDAIILENISPDKAFTGSLDDLVGLDNLIKLNFKILQERELEIPIFGLKYKNEEVDVAFDRDFDNSEWRENIYTEMSRMIKKTLIYDKDFGQWQMQLC